MQKTFLLDVRLHLIKIQVLTVQQLSHFILVYHTHVYELVVVFRSQYCFYIYLKPVCIIEF